VARADHARARVPTRVRRAQTGGGRRAAAP